ncbi:MAG: AraC family transcriptional regulator [Dysgonomonas sp.]|nr:AraC family transcriptional regulator [Dysgonomonas sp.]
MRKSESLQEFYKTFPNEKQEVILNETNKIGHINLFKRWHCTNVKRYLRRDFYRISLIVGTGTLHYGNKKTDITEPTIFLTNKTIPYSWEPISETQNGWVCLFTEEFLTTSSLLCMQTYTSLANQDSPAFILDEELLKKFSTLFETMSLELKSGYTHKYSLLQSYFQILVFEIEKLQAHNIFDNLSGDAAHRTTFRFLELLEQQFPIESPNLPLTMRSPQDYARQLFIHVNHLNNSVKKVTGKTSSELINERIIREAEALLQHTDWTIGEIAEVLGFNYTSHFSAFIRKHTQQSPKDLRSTHILRFL